MKQFLSHMQIRGGDANRASRFGFQVIADSLAFLVVPLKVSTKGDQSSSPLLQARLIMLMRTRIHSFIHSFIHSSISP